MLHGILIYFTLKLVLRGVIWAKSAHFQTYYLKVCVVLVLFVLLLALATVLVQYDPYAHCYVSL
jgi:hypothetical protein